MRCASSADLAPNLLSGRNTYDGNDDTSDGAGHGTAEECITRIRTELAAFSENAPPTDDQTLIVIRCRE